MPTRSIERHLRDWAANCPQNFEDRALLVGAEIARIEGRPLDAMDHYERAIASARANGYVHNEAIANELAARFHAARGFATIANAYLREARSCYLRWGADGKVRQLETLHPFLHELDSARAATTTSAAPIEHLDIATMVKVSQAISGEVVLERLVDTLMRLAIEHAGAERGLLLLSRDNNLRLEAEAMTSQDGIIVRRPEKLPAALPDSIVQYVMRSRDAVILDDALVHPTHSSDSYVRGSSTRSVLCLPLVNDSKVIGVLYLENNLTPHVFTPDRVMVLKVLASQAAISLENSRLYRDLADREGRIQRLWDSNILGICIWNIDGTVVSANDEFLRMLQYDHEDVAAGRLNWAELTPVEWREGADRAVAALRATGSFQPFEKEYLRKDGTRVPVLIGGALFEGGGNQGVAFALDLTERKRAETALRESEERFRDYAETASDWLWEMGPDHKLTLLTGNAFGASPSARLGTAAWERALDLETEPEKWRAIRATMDAHKPFRDFVYLAAGFDGSPPMYVKASGRPVFDSNGEFRGYRGTGTDVTAVTRAQEALRESERSLRSIIDGIPGLVGSLAPNGDIETVNRQILEYYGTTLEELKTRWQDMVHPEDLPRVIEGLTQSITSGERFEVEFRARRFDGVYCWFQSRTLPFRDANGRILRWYNLLTDIDELKRAEEALRESERSLRSAIDGIPGLVAVAAPNGELETVNRQVLEYFGRPAEELKNWGTINIVHPEDLPRILQIFQKSIVAGIPFHYETRLRRFDGEYRWFDARFVPIRDDTGRIARWYVLLTDIEDRTQALARLQQLQSDFAHMNRVSMMGELAASLSHEITQPIASARNNARAAMNFLDKNPPDLSEVREALGCVVGDSDRAGNIIGRIRDQIRKAPPRKDHFDLNTAITEVLALARSAIVRNGVSVQTRLADGLLPVHGDRVQVQQVVLNLTLNAVEAMGSAEAGARELSISTEQDHTGVLVAVRDSGPGIDATNLERVFQAFYTTKSSGTGMGLAICRSIIDAHGGRLWAEGNEPRGAVFQFTLPGTEER